MLISESKGNTVMCIFFITYDCHRPKMCKTISFAIQCACTQSTDCDKVYWIRKKIFSCDTPRFLRFKPCATSYCSKSLTSFSGQKMRYKSQNALGSVNFLYMGLSPLRCIRKNCIQAKCHYFWNIRKMLEQRKQVGRSKPSVVMGYEQTHSNTNWL